MIDAPAGQPGYYVFGTGGGIWFSTDLLNWTYEGQVFDQLPDWAEQAVPGASTYWAPDISFHNGLYYLYYAVSTFGSQQSAIGLATNVTIDPTAPGYKWQDLGPVIESMPGRENFNAIDPALFVDSKGRWNLFFGSYWTGIKVTRIDPHTGKRQHRSAIKAVASRGTAVDPDSIEGAYVIRHGDFYYLFVSWGFCCGGALSTYKIAVGRSKSATGPYVDQTGVPMRKGGGTVVVKGDSRWIGPGHNSVLTTADGQYLLCAGYDADNLMLDRVLQVRPMTWTNDGWPLVGEPLVQQ